MHDLEKLLDTIKSGNKSYVGSLNSKVKADKLSLSQYGQKPLVTILSCADSRIPTESIFNLGIGKIFNLRVAGNIVNQDILGSAEYGVTCLNIPLMIVMGHTHCGAVKAAISNDNDTALPANLKSLLDKINHGKHSCEIDATTHNIRHSIKELKANSEIISNAINNKSLKLVGALYNIETGAVDFDI